MGVIKFPVPEELAPYITDLLIDPRGPASPLHPHLYHRTVRGRDFDYTAEFIRSAMGEDNHPEHRTGVRKGFRVAR